MFRLLHFSFYIIIIFSYKGLSQSYIQLFSEYLPEKYLLEEESREQIEYNIQQFVHSNPDLVYYYIKYLNLVFQGEISNNDSNYYNILQYEFGKSVKQNNDWFRNQIEIAERLNESALVKQAVISLIDDFIIDESELRMKPLKLPIDKNLQKFFSYKSLTKDTSLIFNDDIDYSSLFDNIIQAILDQIKLDQSKYLVDSNYSKMMNFDRLLKNFFFIPEYKDRLQNLNDINLGEYLISEINYPDFKEKSVIGIGVNNQSFDHTFPKQEFDEKFLPFFTYRTENSKNKLNLYNLSVVYKLKLDDFKSSFSNIKFALNYSIVNKSKKLGTQKNDLNTFVFIWEGEPTNFTEMFYGTIKSVSWEIDSKVFSSEISIPIYYFSRNIFFEVGFSYTYINAKYLINVEKEIEAQTSLNPKVLGSEHEQYIMNSDSHLVNATLAANILIENMINFRAAVNTSYAIQLGLEFYFSIF